MKKIAILQSNYIPWKGYFDLINMVDEFIIYDHVQYTKNDWRNRNKIKTFGGTKWLTIPVKQLSLNQKIRDTEIADSRWNRKHWETLKLNYSQTPFFKEFREYFDDLYLQENLRFLSLLNKKFITHINTLLEIKTIIRTDDEFVLNAIDPSEKLIEIIKQCGGSNYLTGASAKNYLNEDLFKQENINITWMNYSGYKEYHQLFPPFEHTVSIVDLIFNEGKNSKKYMKSFENE